MNLRGDDGCERRERNGRDQQVTNLLLHRSSRSPYRRQRGRATTEIAKVSGLVFPITLQYKVTAMLNLLKRPSAFLPIGMSATVLALIAIHIARFGAAHEADEGAEAHLFQLLMPAQLPIVLFFAARWLPIERRPALEVLTLQIASAATVFALVFFLRL
jgi:hypothetical protein